MELEAYLEALEQCPDELLTEGRRVPRWRLTTEFGIYDNFPILFNANYDNVVRDFKESVVSDEWLSGQYHCFKEDKLLITDYLPKESRNMRFNYIPGTVELQLRNWVDGLTHDLGEEKHLQRQRREFNMGFYLHPYQEKEMEGVNRIRVIALVLTDICRYAQKRKIPLCLPNSMGADHQFDYSRIVYFNP